MATSNLYMGTGYRTPLIQKVTITDGVVSSIGLDPGIFYEDFQAYEAGSSPIMEPLGTITPHWEPALELVSPFDPDPESEFKVETYTTLQGDTSKRLAMRQGTMFWELPWDNETAETPAISVLIDLEDTVANITSGALFMGVTNVTKDLNDDFEFDANGPFSTIAGVSHLVAWTPESTNSIFDGSLLTRVASGDRIVYEGSSNFLSSTRKNYNGTVTAHSAGADGIISACTPPKPTLHCNSWPVKGAHCYPKGLIATEIGTTRPTLETMIEPLLSYTKTLTNQFARGLSIGDGFASSGGLSQSGSAAERPTHFFIAWRDDDGSPPAWLRVYGVAGRRQSVVSTEP